jgi:hypothetical protein
MKQKRFEGRRSDRLHSGNITEPANDGAAGPAFSYAELGPSPSEGPEKWYL